MPAPTLTVEQLLILALVADGHTLLSIGHRIGKTKSATGMQLHRIYKQLGARNGAHAVAIAIRAGLLPAPNPGAHQK